MIITTTTTINKTNILYFYLIFPPLRSLFFYLALFLFSPPRPLSQ